MALLFNTLSLALAAALGWLYLYGVEHSFLWIYPWFDTLLHFLGGLVMGLWACAVGVRFSLALRPAFFWISAAAFVGGIAWEVFEYVLQIQGGAIDTLSDISFGIAGAYAAFLLYAPLARHRV